jgi:DNA-binding XRE family transcriptional regulator
MRVKLKEFAMQRKGWSMYKVAQLLELPQQTVYSWSSGRTQPGYLAMDKLCALLECTLNDLFEPEPVQLHVY